jgi:anti-sigma-K factor RskA
VTEADPDMTAAEYALRLLEGEELVAARLRVAREPAFADEVTRWEERFAPFLDEIQPVEPPAGVWARIEAALASEQAPGSNVVALERRVRFWRGASIGVGAVAASLALIVGYQANREDPGIALPPPQEPAQPQPTLVASLASEETDTSLSVAYADGSLLVTPVRVAEVPNADHQLWIIPEGGAPISIGVIEGDAPQRVRLPAELTGQFRPAATIALSREPEGGSPTGQPTGPVVAAGPLTSV